MDATFSFCFQAKRNLGFVDAVYAAFTGRMLCSQTTLRVTFWGFCAVYAQCTPRVRAVDSPQNCFQNQWLLLAAMLDNTDMPYVVYQKLCVRHNGDFAPMPHTNARIELMCKSRQAANVAKNCFAKLRSLCSAGVEQRPAIRLMTDPSSEPHPKR